MQTYSNPVLKDKLSTDDKAAKEKKRKQQDNPPHF